MVHGPAEFTLIVTPSGETQVPCVAGGFGLADDVELPVGLDGGADVVLPLVVIVLGLGLGLGEAAVVADVVGDEDGDGAGLVDWMTTEAVGLGVCLPHVRHGLPADAGDASASKPTRTARVVKVAAHGRATCRADRVIAGAAFRVADGTPQRLRSAAHPRALARNRRAPPLEVAPFGCAGPA
jgi:hypothetical protein